MKEALTVARLHFAWARAQGLTTEDVVRVFTRASVHRVSTDRAIELLAHEWLRASDRAAVLALKDAA